MLGLVSKKKSDDGQVLSRKRQKLCYILVSVAVLISSLIDTQKTVYVQTVESIAVIMKERILLKRKDKNNKEKMKKPRTNAEEKYNLETEEEEQMAYRAQVTGITRKIKTRKQAVKEETDSND